MKKVNYLYIGIIYCSSAVTCITELCILSEWYTNTVRNSRGRWQYLYRDIHWVESRNSFIEFLDLVLWGDKSWETHKSVTPAPVSRRGASRPGVGAAAMMMRTEEWEDVGGCMTEWMSLTKREDNVSVGRKRLGAAARSGMRASVTPVSSALRTTSFAGGIVRARVKVCI